MYANPEGRASKARGRGPFLMLFVLAVSIVASGFWAWAQETQDPKTSQSATQIKKKTSESAAKKRTSKAPTSKSKAAVKVPSQPNSSSSSKASVREKSQVQTKSAASPYTKPSGKSGTRTKASHLEPFKAAVVMEASTGKVVYAHDPHRRLVPASLTKMMLVLVVMEKVRAGRLRLSEPVIASERTTGVGGTQIDLKPGESLPLEEMLQAVLVRSANDAAATVAEHVSGSQARFVELMNQRARALGMADTFFTNVHGLPEPTGHDNMSTAYDMALLAKALLRFPEILHWSSQEVAYIRGGRYPIHSTNKLLGRCQGVDGLKTGFVRKAGFNIAATAARQDRRLIAVVMGSPSSETRNHATADLLSRGFNGAQATGTSATKGSAKENTRGHISSSTRLPLRSDPTQATRG